MVQTTNQALFFKDKGPGPNSAQRRAAARRYVMNMVEGDRIHDLHLDGV